ncbi:MAG: PHB depolymerase family esterase, partial [Rubrivivax sp.]
MVKPLQSWARSLQRIARRNVASLSRSTVQAGRRAVVQALKPAVDKHKPPPGAGDWLLGVAVGLAGARRYRLYRPPGTRFGERLPLMVMLHGCGQDAKSFALSTRMNRVAARERFLVLYPEQDRLANAQGCWNWFDTKSGRAHGEAALIMKAIDQVCLLYAVDRTRVAVAGLSAGASMAALLVARHPERFKALMMHSGIPPGTAHSTLSAIGAMHGLRGTKPLPAAPPMMMSASWPPLMVIHGSD